MPAKDFFHDVVKRALENDGWTITHEQMPIKYSKSEMSIDLGAEKILAAQKGQQKIAVEIKSFIGSSAIYEFHLAVGQYRNYRRALRKLEPEREVYLAVSDDVYDAFFQDEFFQLAIEEDGIKLIIFDPAKEVITIWKS